MSALSEAVESGNLREVKSLVENGANIHANQDDALVMSLAFGHVKVFEYLLSKYPYAHKGLDYALKQACGGPNNNSTLRIVKMLVDHGANINGGDLRNEYGEIDNRYEYGMPLIEAATMNNLKIVKFLVEKGADVKPHLALAGVNLEGLVKYSEAYYDELNKAYVDYMSPLNDTDRSIFAYLIQDKSVKEDAFRAACARGSIYNDEVFILSKRKRNDNVDYMQGFHMACMNNKEDIVVKLINEYGFIPDDISVELATSKGHDELAAYLQGMVAPPRRRRHGPGPARPPPQQNADNNCPPGKILNPATGRCVNINGKIGAALVDSLQRRRNSSPRRSPSRCPPGKILNPATGRCVKRDGKIGKTLV